MIYKKNFKMVMERLRGFYAGESRDRIFAKMMVESAALRTYAGVYPDGTIPYPDLNIRADFWNSYLSEQTDLIDDSIPAAYMSEFDEGLYSALLGASIQFQYLPETGRVCSMSKPLLEKFEDWRSLKLDTDGYWANQYKKQLEFFKQDGQLKYGISHFIIINGLNMSFELRGATNAFYDVIEFPEEMKEFFDFARKVNFWVQDTFFEIIGLFEGGTFSNYGQWMPGRIISESIDPFHMASIDYFEEWGRDTLEKVFARYDGGCLHIHQGNGKHLIHTASTVKGVKIISIVDENFNDDKAYMHLEEYDKLRGEIPLIITIPYDIFMVMMEKGQLPANNFYNVKNVPDAATANKAMEKILEYRR